MLFRSARRTLVIADESKLGVVTFGHVCGLDAVECLVTDAAPEATAELEADGLAVSRA